MEWTTTQNYVNVMTQFSFQPNTQTGGESTEEWLDV